MNKHALGGLQGLLFCTTADCLVCDDDFRDRTGIRADYNVYDKWGSDGDLLLLLTDAITHTYTDVR